MAGAAVRAPLHYLPLRFLRFRLFRLDGLGSLLSFLGHLNLALQLDLFPLLALLKLVGLPLFYRLDLLLDQKNILFLEI
jgi:hypothetical protein